MRDDYTHLTMIVDRSGSMQFTAKEATAAINRLLEEQMSEPGKFTFTITQFDDRIENVTRMNESREPFKYVLQPRGMTALFDAIASEVRLTGVDLSALPAEERPVHVIVLIVTDGYENCSRQYNAADVRSKIKHQREQYNWQFQFLGADESALQGEALGMATTRYSNDANGTHAVYASASAAMTNTRSGLVDSFQMPDEVQ